MTCDIEPVARQTLQKARHVFPLRFCLLTMLASGFACAGDDGSATDLGKVVVVLLDQSQSTRNDRSIYESAVRTILDSLRAGDRIVMAPITSSSGRDFGGSIDYALPLPLGKQGLMDEPIKYRRRLQDNQERMATIRENLSRDVEIFLNEASGSARTTIFESLRVVEPLFDSDGRRGILVLLSDMLEDSQVANFERHQFTDEFIQSEIDRQRSAGTLPSLSGVSVYVVGAVSSPASRAAAVERFWRAYFDAAGTVIGKGHYARVLVSFPE